MTNGGPGPPHEWRGTVEDTFENPGKPPLVRSPLYLLRVVIGVVLTGVGIVLLLIFENALLGLRNDVATLQESWPVWVSETIDVVVGMALIVTTVGTNLYLLGRRKYRRLSVINLAAVVAIVLVALTSELVLEVASSGALERAVERGATPERGLGNHVLASLVAVLTISGPWITRRLRPWATGVLVAAIALSFVGGAIALITLPLDIGIGILAGALVALLVKTPDRTPTAADVARTLAESGYRVTRVERAAVDAQESVAWFARTDDDTELFVKASGTDQRAADLLFRLYRFIRLRNAGDRHPFTSLRRAAEHEALLSLAAASRGIRTPQLVAVAEIGTDGMLLAYRRIHGRPLDTTESADISPAMLGSIWDLVNRLHHGGIAHRDLQLANILVADDGEPWLVDFGFAELAADADLQARDVAELLASTAVGAGRQPAVDAAVEALGRDRVASALPWIQPLALTTATRTRIGKTENYQRLRETVADAVGIDEIEFERLERVRPRTVFIMATVALAAYALVPQLASATGFLDEVGRAQLGWVGVVVVASLLTYVGAALGMIGAVPVRIGVRPMTMAQLASSFSNRVTPAKVGGMATNVRFLQKQGIPAATAVSAVGLNTLAGFAVHVTVLVSAAALAGTGSGTVDLPLPSTRLAVILAGALVLVAALSMLLRVVRRALTTTVWPALRAAVSAIVAIARTPAKLAALFAGSVLVTASYTTAMLASLYAFGADIPVAAATVVYLTASAVADVAPTPGGVGAAEAALIGGFTAVGLDAATAFAAVLLFRLVTFWLPIAPGWWALVTLQRRGEL